MPTIYFEITWPDGDKKTYYSPSTVIREHLKSGEQYSLEEFSERINAALNAASERVRERFGYYCSAAADELYQINSKLKRLRHQRTLGAVHITRIDGGVQQ